MKSKVRGTKTARKGKSQQTQETNIFLVSRARQFQGFIVIGSHDQYGSMIPASRLPATRLEWEKKIAGKNETEEGKLTTFQDSITLVSAWLSAKGCVKNKDRAELLAIAKSVFGKHFEKLATLPVALLVRQKTTQNIVELIAVSEKVDLSEPDNVECFGDAILAFRGDASVINHFVAMVRQECSGLNGHTCVGAILYTDKSAKPK